VIAPSQSRSYWPALDGLRGFAILLVVLAHAGVLLGAVGGQVGVTLFFVLSGFLITTIVVTEKDASGTINLRRFYGRRARRLLPALMLFLVVSSLFFSAVIDDFPFWASSWPGLFYVSNYTQILGVEVYANTHLWSLSVEEHFYALWPLILLVPKRLPSAATLLKIALALVALRFVVGWGYPTWAYYGTLTNSYALLLGCSISVAKRDGTIVRTRRGVAGSGAVGLVLLGMWPTVGLEELSFTGVWIPVMAALVSALMVIALTEKGAFYFEMSWLRYLGRVSYGWYLWHAPFLFISQFNDTPIKRVGFALMTLAVASVSWHLVERRMLIRRDGPTGLSNLEPQRSDVL